MPFLENEPMPNPTHGALDRLTDAIVKSYRSDKRTQRIGAEFLPGRDAIVEIIHEIRELLSAGSLLVSRTRSAHA